MASTSTDFLLEIVKIVATPAMVAFFGVALLRRIESVKTLVARQSDFHKKWADEFFLCCNGFTQDIIRELTLLVALGTMNPTATKSIEGWKDEIAELHPTISAYELRMRQVLLFAPTSGPEVTKAASECISILKNMVAALTSGSTNVMNFDPIVDKMKELNNAARKAHAEMLGVASASK